MKLDNLQPSGSFKSRGIGNYVLHRLEERNWDPQTHFYASSGGNAGIACVHAAKSLGFPATVVVPTSVKRHIVAKLKATGAADVIQYGDSVLEADRYLKSKILKEDPNGVYVPPFDHPDIWTGNGSVMTEIIEQLGEKPNVVVCSVGGGGLLNGIEQVLDERGWAEDVEVVAMETEGADSLNRSIKAGQLITMDRITSQATSLGVARVSEKTWEYAQRPQVKTAVLPDKEAARGCWLFAQHERMMVELTAGINIVLCFDGLLEKVLGHAVDPSSKVVLIVCGGSDISIEMLADWRASYDATVGVSQPQSNLGIAEPSQRVQA